MISVTSVNDEKQRLLAAMLAQRHRRAAQGLAADSQAETGEARPERPIAVVLRQFDLDALVTGAMTFAAGLSRPVADAWFRDYTRAFFFFGNPRNLAARYPIAVSAGDAAMAWLGPFDPVRMAGLRRLIKAVRAPLPELATQHIVAGRTPMGADVSVSPRRLYIATRGLDLAQYLIHLNHTLAESVLLGALAPDATVRLVHCLDLDEVMAETDYDYVRVHYASDDDNMLRIYTLLATE